jgi:hypothetical protein
MDDSGIDIPDVYYGVIFMESVIKKFKDAQYFTGGITVYVMIMFGMTVILYMMNFTTMWDGFISRNVLTSEFAGGITDWDLFGVSGGFITALVTLLSGLILTGVLIKWIGGAQVLGYVLPLAFLAFFNIFIFPVVALEESLRFTIGTLPAAAFLLAFFNLFLILSIIEFTRSGAT